MVSPLEPSRAGVPLHAVSATTKGSFPPLKRTLRGKAFSSGQLPVPQRPPDPRHVARGAPFLETKHQQPRWTPSLLTAAGPLQDLGQQVPMQPLWAGASSGSALGRHLGILDTRQGAVAFSCSPDRNSDVLEDGGADVSTPGRAGGAG